MKANKQTAMSKVPKVDIEAARALASRICTEMYESDETVLQQILALAMALAPIIALNKLPLDDVVGMVGESYSYAKEFFDCEGTMQ